MRRFSEPPRPDVVFDECEVVDYPGGFLGTQQLGTDWQITMSFFELMSLCKRGHVLMLSEGCERLYIFIYKSSNERFFLSVSNFSGLWTEFLKMDGIYENIRNF